MPTIVNDLEDKISRLAVAYGRHAVKGHLTKHFVEFVGAEKQVTVQRALGAGPWDSNEKLFDAGDEITAGNSNFHQGLPNDAADAYFPTDIPHPNAAYESTRLPLGFGDEDRPDRMVGIYKTLQVADYDGAGVQTGFGYSPSPARHILDMRLRAKRSPLHVNYPSWVDWRDYSAELIDWDDGALTPHYITLTASAGGSLAPGTYWIKVATKKGADISSASKDRANDGVTTASVVISGANLQFTVDWATQEERGATGYRVYIGTSENGEDRFFDVAGGATHTLLITTLTGASMGTPPTVATGALLRQIPRFESHLFFPPPFELPTAMDRIAQITCMDWHYANGKLVFLTPEVRTPVMTLDLAEIGSGSFKTYQVDRRQKPHQISVNYRDLDDQYLKQADPPVIVNRTALQDVEGVRPFEINGGCMYRSQAERVGHFWARRLIDSDQIIDLTASPKTYIVLPGEVIDCTHDVPNWTNVKFCIEEKEEAEDSKAGYPMIGRVYPESGSYYSDTDHSPLPRPFPSSKLSPFTAPPVVVDLTLTQSAISLVNGLPFGSIHGAVQFANFIGHQRGRVWWWKPGGIGYEATAIVLVPEPLTMQAAFELPGVAVGLHKLKVVTESAYGMSLPFIDHPEETITIAIPGMPNVTGFLCNFDDGTADGLLEWAGTTLPAAPSLDRYELEIRNLADTDTVRGPIVIAPAELIDASSVPALEIHPVTFGIPSLYIDPSHYVFKNGGVQFAYSSAEAAAGKFAKAQSKAEASLLGGFLIQFQLWQKITGLPPIYMALESSGPSYGWRRTSDDPMAPMQVSPDGTSLAFQVGPGDRLGMLVRADRILEFHINYLGRSSVPVFIYPDLVDDTLLYRLIVREAPQGVTTAFKSGIKESHWLRGGPEWPYIAEMQSLDYGLLAPAVPATIKARVRQLSFYPDGEPSAWTNGVFTR